MTVKELRERLRAMRVFNDYEILVRFGVEGRDVVVRYHPGGDLGSMCYRTSVYSPSFKTDPNAHWTNNGTKTFLGNRASTLHVCLAWASEQYGVEAWVTSPFGGAKIPAEVLKAARAAAVVRGPS